MKALKQSPENVVVLWRLGYDTVKIAHMTRFSEAEVYRIISAEQDRRHAEKQGRAA